jgi:hypothetical protein
VKAGAGCMRRIIRQKNRELLETENHLKNRELLEEQIRTTREPRKKQTLSTSQ